MNEARLLKLEPTQTVVRLCQWKDIEAELDEMWSFVGSKQHQRWLWHAIDHTTGEVLAYVLAEHKDTAFLELKALLDSVLLSFTQTVGVRMNGISNRCFTQWVKLILRRLSASI